MRLEILIKIPQSKIRLKMQNVEAPSSGSAAPIKVSGKPGEDPYHGSFDQTYAAEGIDSIHNSAGYDTPSWKGAGTAGGS